MKIIFGTGAFGEPYRIDIPDALLEEAIKAQKTLRMLPWDGEMFLPCPAKALKDICGSYLKETVEIVVGKRSIWLKVDGPEGREPLLPLGEVLLSIPNLYVTKSFEDDLAENAFSLDIDDIELIESWKLNKVEFEEN